MEKIEILPVSVCANCEVPIYPGVSVWKKGKDLFCKSDCLIQSFEQQKKEPCSNTDPQ